MTRSQPVWLAHPGPGESPLRAPGPSRLEIALAVPSGSRRARSQRAFLAALAADPELAELRCDARHNVMTCARIWARHACWRTLTTRPTRARVCEQARISVSTYKACRRWLEARGYLGLVSPGRTQRFRPMALADPDAPNEAAVLVLAVPRRKSLSRSAVAGQAENRPPTGSRREPCLALRAREASSKVKTRIARAPRGLPSVPPHPDRPLTGRAKTRSDGLAAAAVVRDRSRQLAALSPEHVRHLARQFLAAGWTAADVLHALDHDPGGRQHGYTAAVRSAAGWARSRLAAWLDSAGAPLPSRSQVRAARRVVDQAEQSTRRQEAATAAERAAKVDVQQRAAEARALLAQALRARPARPWPGKT